MIVAVLGGGNGGDASAADFALAGHEVRVWRGSEEELAPVKTGRLTLVADGRRSEAGVRATADLREAVGGAEVIVVALPATAHEALARELAPHFEERHVVLLAPGCLGSFAMAREVARAGGRLPFAFAETGTAPHLARQTGPAEVEVAVRAANLPLGVFPASRSADTLKKVAALYPTVRPCADALDAALANPAIVLHPPLVLLNLGAVETGRFDVRAAAVTGSARRLIEAVDRERLAARQGWGYRVPHYELATIDDQARAAEGLYGAGAREHLLATGLGSETPGLEHRYVTEDVALGLSLFESAARTVSADTPAITGLLHVFRVLLGRELSGRGRALEQLGLADLVLREIRAFLYEGWTSPFWPRVIR